MFNQGNTDYEDQPSYMSLETLKATTAYIKKGIEDIGITDLVIIFHGGEPMMLKPHKFESFCILDLILGNFAFFWIFGVFLEILPFF